MITEQTYWEMEVCKDFYKILENNLWNRQHPEVHAYLIVILNTCGFATSKEELEKRFKNCIELRISSGIKNTEEIEQEMFNKYVRQWKN